jgi:hypothetical protein
MTQAIEEKNEATESFDVGVGNEQIALAQEFDKEMGNIRNYLMADLEADHTLAVKKGEADLNVTAKHMGRTAAAELAVELDAISLHDSQNSKPVNANLSRKLSEGFRAFYYAEEQMKMGHTASAFVSLKEARKQLDAFRTDLFGHQEYAQTISRKGTSKG